MLVIFLDHFVEAGVGSVCNARNHDSEIRHSSFLISHEM